MAAWLVGSTLVRRGVMGWRRAIMPISSMTLASSSCEMQDRGRRTLSEELGEEARVLFGLQSLPEAAF